MALLFWILNFDDVTWKRSFDFCQKQKKNIVMYFRVYKSNILFDESVGLIRNGFRFHFYLITPLLSVFFFSFLLKS